MLKRSFLSLVAILLLLTAGACNSAKEQSPDIELSERIAVTVKKGPGTTLEFANLTDFSWDQLHVFGPYTPEAEVERELGFDWPGVYNTGISMLEGDSLLVFVKDQSVVSYVEHPRNQGDFAPAASKSPWTPDSALFVVREDPDDTTVDGKPWFVVLPSSEATAP